MDGLLVAQQTFSIYLLVGISEAQLFFSVFFLEVELLNAKKCKSSVIRIREIIFTSS